MSKLKYKMELTEKDLMLILNWKSWKIDQIGLGTDEIELEERLKKLYKQAIKDDIDQYRKKEVNQD